MNLSVTSAVGPYKGLAPFEDSELDALLFFGRERDTEVIVANLLATKLTVLYGPSGVGKSSVLHAAVVRRLRELAPDADVLLLDEWATRTELPEVAGEAFLVFDQFEEYFLYHDLGELQAQLPPLLAQRRVHALIALREDALGQLDALEARIPNVLANRLRLDYLDPSAARAAIVRPLDHWNANVAPDERVGIESALIEAILHQVESRPGRIEAPYLQLVLERLWNHERADGSAMLRAATLDRLGGAEAIVNAHLEYALGALTPRDAAIATSALRFLVTPSRTKIAHSFGDLVSYTNEPPVELRQVLEALASQRIVRAIADGDEAGRRYEIFHDVLAEPVLAWRREFDARAALRSAARRHRRLAVLAAGALLLAVAMVLLAVYAFAQRGEASKQRRTALHQAEVAIGQKRLAQQRGRAALIAEQRARRAQHQANASEARAKRSAAAAKRSARAAAASAVEARASERKAVVSAAEEKKSAAFATHERRIAQRQAVRARKQALLAKVGELVATAAAELGVDPVQSVRAALAASDLERSTRVEDVLRESLVGLRVRGILRGGGGSVNAAVFSPDGRLVATGSVGGRLRIFRTADHVLVRDLKTGSAVEGLVFSPDGTLLAAALAGRAAVVYDVASGRPRFSLQHDGSVLAVAFAGDGRFVVTGSADRSVRIWDSASGALLHVVHATAAQPTLAVSPDGSLVAVRSNGQATAHVYDVASGTSVGAVTQQGEVTDLDFSPNGSYLVTTGRRNAYVWDVRDWSLLHVLSGHEATITSLAFAADDRLVTASVDGSARVWDPASGADLYSLVSQHQQAVLAVAVSPDGSEIATASEDETARIWGAPLGSVPLVLAGHTDSVGGVSFSRDGRLVLTASADGTARLWDPAQPSLATLGLRQGSISMVAYNPDGRLLLGAGADGSTRLWRAGGTPSQTLVQGGKVNAAAFVSSRGLVLTAGDDGTAKLWRAGDGSLIGTYVHGAPVEAAAFTAGADVVTAGSDGVVKAWAGNGRLLWSESQGAALTTLAAAGGVIATGAADGSIRLWRGRDGAPLRELGGHQGRISSLAFSPDGTLLASAGADSTARIWNVDTGGLVHTLVGHQFGITSVSFSPNGTLVLTSGIDGDARIWSVRTGRTLHRLRFHVATVSDAAFSPDGRWVVTAGPSTAGIWQVRTGRLLYFLTGAHGTLTSTAWAPSSLSVVVGDAGGGVETFRCAVCVGLPGLQAQAKARLRDLG